MRLENDEIIDKQCLGTYDGMNVHSAEYPMSASPAPIAHSKREAVLQATLDLIATQGLQGTPMSQIAQRARLGVGTIYRYFATKDELINALYVQLKTRVNRFVVHDLNDSLTVKEAFRQSLLAVFDYYLAHPTELAFLSQYENSPVLTAATREENVRLSEPAYALIERGQAQGLIKALPAETIGILYSGAVLALVKHCIAAGSRLPRAELQLAVESIWDLVATQ